MSNRTDSFSGNKNETKVSAPIVPHEYRAVFVLLVTCFILWGLLNNMTDTLVPAFKKIFSLTDEHSSTVQLAFYSAYAALAIPAAIIIKKFSYKTGVLVGLLVYSIGALGYIPATLTQSYDIYLVSIFILAGGLSVLETSCNPYVLALGDPSTAVRRLNVAQMFNPIGSLTGLLIGKFVILSELHPTSLSERLAMDEAERSAIMDKELFWLTLPYVFLVLVAIAIFVMIMKKNSPENVEKDNHKMDVLVSVKKLLQTPKYYCGVIAQLFYVGAQITVWTFTIRYAMAVFPSLTEDQASYYTIYSLILFFIARMICTALMKKFNPAKMMAVFAVAGIVLSICAVNLPGMYGLWSLIFISGSMSLMFPTIYGIALNGMGEEVKWGASGLIFSIVGGALITKIQGWLIGHLCVQELLKRGYDFREKAGAELVEAFATVPQDIFLACDELAVRHSYYLPIICFVVILIYAVVFRNAHLKIRHAS